MASFLKLTDKSTGGPVHINFDHVEKIYPNDRGGTRLVFAKDFLIVSEDYDDLVPVVERYFAQGT